MEIQIRAAGDFVEVVVAGETTTRHMVRVDADELPPEARGVDRDVLVRDSFDFLLEREPNTSILTEFALSEIGRYFPEYPAWLRARYRDGGTGADYEAGRR